MPRQARSEFLVSAILEAAVRVLEEDGRSRFTTVRVAERAGISVGSLYQYFPNKAAILFRLQEEEWRRTGTRWRKILAERDRPPPERLRALVHMFLHSECEEAAVREALREVAPGSPDDPEPDAGNPFAVLVREMLPDVPDPARTVAAELAELTLTRVAHGFSERPRAPDEIAAFAEALSDMLCRYLRSPAGHRAGRAGPGRETAGS